MSRGRPKKPTATLKLAGTYRSDRHGGRAEPQPDPSMPERPKGLDAQGRKAWDRLAPELHRVGLLTVLDRDLLASYCRFYSLAVECWRGAKKDGPVVMVAGKPQQNPYIGSAHKAEDMLRKLRRELGMTPSARAGLSVAPPPEGDDLESYLKL